MLTMKVANAQARSSKSSTNEPASKPPMLAGYRSVHDPVEHALLRSIGNRAAVGLLTQRFPSPNARSRDGIHQRPAPVVQAKLAIGAVDDPLEHEADRVAEQVMRMPAPRPSITASPPRVSRKCAAWEE